VIEPPTARCTSSPSAGFGPIPAPRPTSQSASPRVIPSSRPFGASNATSHARSSRSSCSVRKRSTKSASPLDKQKGVRGSPYCSTAYQAELTKRGILISMSGTGNCYDNAGVETFFKTLKAELIWRTVFQTRAEAKEAIARSIDSFYNPSSQRTSLYVVEGKRFCWPGSDTAGCLGLVLARRARVWAAGPSISARLKSHGPSSRGCSASMSPRSAAIRSVRGATPTRAEA
jgi:Integrase core domain